MGAMADTQLRFAAANPADIRNRMSAPATLFMQDYFVILFGKHCAGERPTVEFSRLVVIGPVCNSQCLRMQVYPRRRSFLPDAAALSGSPQPEQPFDAVAQPVRDGLSYLVAQTQIENYGEQNKVRGSEEVQRGTGAYCVHHNDRSYQ